MRKEQKKEITEQVDSLLMFTTELQFIVDDLQEAFDNKSDKWRESEAGELAATRISNIEEAIAFMEEASSQLEQSIE